MRHRREPGHDALLADVAGALDDLRALPPQLADGFGTGMQVVQRQRVATCAEEQRRALPDALRCAGDRCNSRQAAGVVVQLAPSWRWP
jgi:hypothetical protein